MDTDDTEQGVAGTMRADGHPISGVILTAYRAGIEVDSTRTDDNGRWEIRLSPPGSYEIQLDVTSLPAGVVLASPERNPYTIEVLQGRIRPVLFGLRYLQEDQPATSGLLAKLQSTGTITIGIANEVPFGYLDADGNPAGAAPDVVRAVIRELGIARMDAKVFGFGDLIGALQVGEIDMIAAGMYINQPRPELILFSDPDYCITESFAVAEGNPHGIGDYQSIVDNPDVMLAVASGTVEIGYAEDAGVPDNQLSVFASIGEMYDALSRGQVDAVAGSSFVVQQEVGERDGMEAVPGFLPRDRSGEVSFPCGGHGFRTEDRAFRDAFNHVLSQLRRDGTTMRLITRYDGFSSDDVEVANRLSLEDIVG